MPTNASDGRLRVTTRTRRLAATSAAIGGLALVAACGGGSANAGDSASKTDSSAVSDSAAAGSPAALLPSKYKSSGAIVDASAFDYPPYDYTDNNGKYIGLEPDLLQAIAPILGVKINYTKLA